MKSYRRKFVVVLGVVITAAILLLAFLPTLVSTAPVRRFILQRVHSATGARVEVDEWSFSWRKPQQVGKILYHDDESGLHATVHRITVAHGLLTMLRDRNTGDIVLERPLLTIRLPEPEPLPTDPVPGEPAPVPDPEDPEPVAWPPFIPRLSCHDGSVIIESDQRLLAIGDLELLIEREPDPSTALNVRLSGRQLDTSDGRMRLQCDGMLRYDLDALTQRAAEWQMTLPVTAHGSAERPFTIHMPLDNAWLRDGTVSASIAIERLEGYGLRSDSLDIPLTLQDGVASAIIATGIHEGNIDLRPRLQSMDERLVLTLPADATVLHKIPLTDELADDLLSTIHPAFSGAVATSGTVDLEFAEFYLPLAADADHEIVFRGMLQLRDVTLEAADVLDRARSLARIHEAVYRIDDQDIRFVCADGRVETSPLQLRIEGHQITLSGSMGLDETLDYTIRTPVTQRLVGRDVYNYLRDATINIPVRGTVSRPQLGEEEVREAVADLIRQAGRGAIERGAQDLLRQFLE